MGRKRCWSVIACLSFLSVFMMLGVVSAQDYNPAPGDLDDTTFNFISIEDSTDRTFTGGITITGGNVYLAGSGTTIFNSTLTTTDSSGGNTGNPSTDAGIYIVSGTNKFNGNVSAGYLTSDGGDNTFEGTVTLWDEDRDPSDNEPLTGYAIGIGGGTANFKDNVIISSNKHAAFINSTSTFAKHLNAGTGDVEIGVSDRVAGIFGGYGVSLPDTPSKIILNGTSAKITAARVNIFNKGVLQVDSAATIDGKLNILEGGKATSGSGDTLTLTGGMRMWNGSSDFAGAVSISGDDLFINGKSNAIFRDALTVTDGIAIMNESDTMPHGQETANATGSTNEFFGAVTADNLAIDTEAGSSTNTFHDTVTLNGFDPDVSGNNTSLIVIDGTNKFVKDVVTGNKHALFAKSTATFNAHLNAGSGEVSIGFGGMIQSITDERYNQTATLILDGNSAKITAGKVNVYSKGILDVRGNANIAGNIDFLAGSEFAIDAKNLLTVSGAATIETGAMANVQNVDAITINYDQGKVILTASSVSGEFGSNGLYTVATEGNTVKIVGINGGVFDNPVIMTGNSANAGTMAIGVLQDASASPLLRTNLSNAIQNIISTTASNPAAAKIATSQLFGEHALSGAAASQATAQSFAGSVGNHQTQLRDNSQASAASANSSSAYASLRTIRQGYSSFNPNRIWGGGFGAWTRQDDKDNQFGYKYNSGGFILGYDREFGVSPTGSFVAGLSAAYSTGEIKNNEGFTTTDVDTFNVGLYASYNHCSGFFADVNAGFGLSWNKTDTTDVIAGGGLRKEGKYRNTSFQMGTTVGYAFTLPQEFKIIPSIGLQYTHVSQQGWSEKIRSPSQIANWFGKSNSNYLSMPVQVRVNKTFSLGGEASITPEVRAAWIYEAKDPQARVRMGYVGSNASATLHGIDPGRSRGLLGVGVKAKFNRHVDAFVDYNFEFRSGYKNHNIMAGLGLSF